ncbi:MAG TPA: secretion system protein E, partial [Verrucomicrobiales bacterium]|nr:secretion system protein E [Verrucomicrobiales bacterium]
MAAPFLSIKTILQEAELVSQDQFETWTQQWRTAVEGGSEDTMLEFFSREKGVTDEQFLKQLADALKWPFVDLQSLSIASEIRSRISTKVAFQYGIMPAFEEDGVLLIAVSNPFTAGMLNAVQYEASGPVRYGLATAVEIDKALKKYYGVGAETIDELAQDEVDDDDDLELMFSDDKEIAEGDQEASIIKFVNQVIWQAYRSRATDIHFEPHEDELQIRHRIDGILHQMSLPPALKKLQAALISRIKVMSGMNIAEKRLPQDGRINVRIKGEEIDIRVSTVPTVY